MNRAQLSRLAHADHPIAAPLGDDSVRRLLEHGLPRPDARVLDLGCGGGEWLLRALASHPGVRAEGVDSSAEALADARRAAHARGVHERLVLHEGDAAGFASPHRFDLVLCVGAAHAFGGLPGALAAARGHLAPGGRVLVGDGFWAGAPSPEAVGLLGELADLPATVDRVTGDGWVPVHGHVSTRRELDAYEWAWTGSLASWALDHPDDPDHARALATAEAHRTEWLRGYRDSFGFVCLVLRPAPGTA
ncbi:SAM-dependent methyltransferase [Streptomyces sp. NPDC085946]|uniref:SAM-dependent methyltransferase n=1 Tax=Streptomyces sp. NPDC085946 TaxID=3365744 RepID=UPI0037D69E13